MPKRKMKVEQPDTEDSTRWRHEERSGCAHLVAESARRTCAVAARTVRCFIIVVKSVVHRKCEGGVVALMCTAPKLSRGLSHSLTLRAVAHAMPILSELNDDEIEKIGYAAAS